MKNVGYILIVMVLLVVMASAGCVGPLGLVKVESNKPTTTPTPLPGTVIPKNTSVISYNSSKNKVVTYNNSVVPMTYSMISTPFGVNGGRLVIYDNPNSTDHNSDEVYQLMLKSGRTTEEYNTTHDCSDFAREFHKDAELEGFNAGVAVIGFSDGTYHVVDTFNTTDHGIMYVDPTGLPLDEASDMTLPLRPRIGVVQLGAVYEAMSIDGCATWTAPWQDNENETIMSVYLY